MFVFALGSARKNSQWLALVISLVIAAGTIVMTLLWPAGSQATDRDASVTLWPLDADFSSPQHCRECHEAQFQAWSDTTHANASFDPIFQVYWEREQESRECLSCHTTGYDYTTGQFALAGVTCEACHGPYQPEHPDESMAIAASEELCGTCHMRTLSEWQSSRHGQVGVTCADCHEVHAQKTRSVDNINALCAKCHQDQLRDATHTVHTRDETDVYCIDCHLVRLTDDVGAMVKGQAITGHSFMVLVSTCDDCHPAPLTPDADSP